MLTEALAWFVFAWVFFFFFIAVLSHDWLMILSWPLQWVGGHAGRMCYMFDTVHISPVALCVYVYEPVLIVMWASLAPEHTQYLDCGWYDRNMLLVSRAKTQCLKHQSILILSHLKSNVPFLTMSKHTPEIPVYFSVYLCKIQQALEITIPLTKTGKNHLKNYTK